MHACPRQTCSLRVENATYFPQQQRIFRGSGLIFYTGKSRRQEQQTTVVESGTVATVVAAASTMATVQQGATVASHMELYVVGAQPYDNKLLCSTIARMILYHTANSRSGVGVGPPLICGRKNKASEYILFASGCRSKLRSQRNKSGQISTNDQAIACLASYIPRLHKQDSQIFWDYLLECSC